MTRAFDDTTRTHTAHISHHTSHHVQYTTYHVQCHELLVILRDHVTDTLHLFYHKMRVTTKRG